MQQNLTMEKTKENSKQVVGIKQKKNVTLNYRKSWVSATQNDTIFGVKSEGCKIKKEIDKLWKLRCSLSRKDKVALADIPALRQILTETIDLTSKVRVRLRDKDRYNNADVEGFCREINGLQMLFHGSVDIWDKAKGDVRRNNRAAILPDILELSTDLSSLFSEILTLFMQRFDLNVVPILRPVHGLFYALSLHCKHNALDTDLQLIPGALHIYSSFLSGTLGLLRSTKVLLKRLQFEDSNASARTKMAQNAITDYLTETSIVVNQGVDSATMVEYRQLIFKVGGIFTDAFFIVGKTKGINDYLELGEDVVATGPLEHLGSIAYCDVSRCSMERRADVLSTVNVQDGHSFVSDVYQITSSTFQCEDKITIKFPVSKSAIPASSTIKVKIKCGKWIDVIGELKDGYVHFQAKYLTAFVALVGQRAFHREVPLTAFTYISEDDSRVRIHFPENCFDIPVIVQFRLFQLKRNRIYSYKESCPDVCSAITAISDILYVKFDHDVILKKPCLVHLPITNDVEDPESEIAILRVEPNGNVVTRVSRSAVRCESTGNCYTFQIEDFNGIALAKVKRKNLKKNLQYIQDELILYMETEHICTILTFLDKALLHVGIVKVWVEMCEKRNVKKILKRRSNEGLFEVPGSRSSDFRHKEHDPVYLDLDGNIQKIQELPSEHYCLFYMNSAKDNYRSFPVEPRKDPRGRQVGIINYYKVIDGGNMFLHSATVDANRFLISLSRQVSAADSRPGTYGYTPWSRGSVRSAAKSVKSSIQYRSMFDEQPILSHQSLLILAGQLTMSQAQMVGQRLGISHEDLMDFRSLDQPTVVTVFEILWEWRGKIPNPSHVEQLVQALNDANLPEVSDVVANVYREKRHLRRSDFQ